jgi:hypothetical protein
MDGLSLPNLPRNPRDALVIEEADRAVSAPPVRRRFSGPARHRTDKASTRPAY